MSTEITVEGLDDAEDAGRHVRCELERLLEMRPNTITTVEITIEETGHRERHPETTERM